MDPDKSAAKASGYVLPQEKHIERMQRMKERKALGDEEKNRVSVGLDVDDVNFVNSQIEMQDATLYQQRQEVRQVMVDAAKVVVTTQSDKNYLELQQKNLREKARQKREAEMTKKSKLINVIKLVPTNSRKRKSDNVDGDSHDRERSRRSRSRSNSRSRSSSPRRQEKDKVDDKKADEDGIQGDLGGLLNY